MKEFTQQEIIWFRDLGLKPTENLKDVRIAFLKIAKAHHPDTSKRESSRNIFQKAVKARDSLIKSLSVQHGQDLSQDIFSFLKKNGLHLDVQKIFSGGHIRVEGFSKEVFVDVPPGSLGYSKILVEGKDVFVNISCNPIAGFVQNGCDLKKDISVGIMDVILGVRVDLSLIDQSVFSLSIPEGMQPDSVLRIRGQGLPKGQNSSDRGDLLVKVVFDIPQNLSEYQRSCAVKFSESLKNSSLKKEGSGLGIFKKKAS